MRRQARAFGAAGILVASSAFAWALEVGDKAPELDVSGWAQGAPLKIADGAGKTVFVVEFLTTFKPETQRAFAAASKLYERNKAKGLEVVAVSTESEAEVKRWLEDHKAGFRFAVDESRNAIVEFAGDSPSLPYAVVVDKAGVVVFAGDPQNGMEKLVEDVLAGRFDPKRAAQTRALREELGKALEADDHAGADALCDKILALEPGDEFAFDRRCDGFEQREDLDGYRKFVKASAETLKDDATALSRIAWRSVEGDRVQWRDPELAVTTARRAVEMSKGADADLIDTYAHVLWRLGLLEQAIAETKKAVAVDAANEGYKKKLAFLESCLALRQKVQPAAPTPPKKK